MRLWVDDTELESDADVGTPDVFVYGGVALTLDQERSLLAEIRGIKTKFSKSAAYRDMPLKWNMKDVSAAYSLDEDSRNVLKTLVASSKDWRAAIFEAVAKSGAKLFVTPVEAYSPKKEVINETRAQCARYGFVNVLQRFAMYAKASKAGEARIVVDWPHGGDRSMVEKEYEAAYGTGQSTVGNKYSSGPLHEVGFDDAPMFSITQQSAMLQVADLVVGASRYFLSATLHKKEYGPGLTCLRQVRENFHGGADNAHRYSFVPSGKQEFCALVNGAVRHEVFEMPKMEPPA